MSSPAFPIGLCERWNALLARLARASERAGRPPPRLVLVTKSVEAEVASALAGFGQIDLGENRVQNLELKAEQLRLGSSPTRWHLLGHLQRNKARRALSLCHSIHSVDSLELLSTLSRLGSELNRACELYLEVDYVCDGVRTGLPEKQVPALLDAASSLPNLRIVGLMTIAPLPEFDGDTRRARAVFSSLRQLSERLPAEAFVNGRPLLSMGMSSDFEIAIEEGSDCVRIGSALFDDKERDA